MEKINLVSEKEIADIQDSFNKVISWVGSIESPNTDKLFNKWLEAKTHFISSFGGLIYTYPNKVSFKISDNEKKDYFSKTREFISSLIVSHEKDIDSQILSWFDSTITPNSLFENETTENYVFNSRFLGKRILVPKGAKIIKAFRRFFNSKELLSSLQNFCSEFIQKNKIEGYLCASVHPLDFLSLSENTYNWRTCHSLDGEFRAGNLSYMIDNSTFIVYLRSEKIDNILPTFPNTVQWNSKKWRMLMFLSDDYQMMFAGRQYPFECDNILSNYIDDLLIKARIINEENDNWTKWTQNRYIGEKDNFITDPLYPIGDSYMAPIRQLVHESEYPLEFNDLLHSSCYVPYWKSKCTKFNVLKNTTSQFSIGSEVKCLKCENNNIQYSETFLCNKCLLQEEKIQPGVVECDYCKKRIFYDDAFYITHFKTSWTDTLCEDCVSKYAEKCSHCEDYYFKEDLIKKDNLDGTFKKICLFCSNKSLYKF